MEVEEIEKAAAAGSPDAKLVSLDTRTNVGVAGA
jgi:hypothetical protein